MSSARPRVAVGGFSHESNSFTGIPTTMEVFLGPSGELVRGEDLLSEHRGVNTVPGGLLEGAEEQGLEARPILYAAACPGGPLDRSTYEQIRDELVEGIAAQRPLDGVLLALHGAMVAEGYPDPEGDLLRRLRQKVGDVPIVSVLDLHANVTEEMVTYADLVVGYKTHPHVDLAECGRKASRLLAGIIRGDLRPQHHFVWLPVLLPSMNMRTLAGPMAAMQARGRELCENDSRCLDVSIFGGFPYADVPAAGASVVVYTNDDQGLARELATRLAEEYWHRKEEFWVPMPTPEEAVARALQAQEWPVALTDTADNPDSGGVGDTTTLLRLLLEKGATQAVVAPIYDPATVARAVEVGVGNRARFEVGGKVNPQHGLPVIVEAHVRLLSDGHYVNSGPMGRGKEATMGRTAVLQVGGVEVVVCEGRNSVKDPEMLRSIGIEPTRRRLLAVKAKNHFRAGYADLMKEIIDVDAPGAATFDVRLFQHAHVVRPIYPYDLQVTPTF